MKTLLLIGAFALVSTMSQGQQQAHAQTRSGHANAGIRVVDNFRDDALDEDWTWVRENATGWRLTKSGIEILVEPGTMWSKTGDANNVLLRKLPAGWESGIDIACELWHSPKKRWEQANLVWYFDDGHMVKLGLEIENGVPNIVMGRKENNQGKTLAIIPYSDPEVQLRLTDHVVDDREREMGGRCAWTGMVVSCGLGRSCLPHDRCERPSDGDSKEGDVPR